MTYRDDNEVRMSTRQRLAAIAVATVLAGSLAACYDKGSLEGSSVQLVTVDARKFEVRVAPTGNPDEYRMLIVRATMVYDPDPEREQSRAEEVARRMIPQTCKGRPYEEIIATLSGVNYRTVFRCK
jgi:hypothetical protein